MRWFICNNMKLERIGLIIIVCCLLVSAFVNAFENLSERVQKDGYSFENISVITEDGYILDLFRIQRGTNVTVRRTPPVLLVHGLFGSSTDFLCMGPQRGLAYLLANHGYDVWLANGRGTTYSRKHVTLNPDVDSKFWDFSWHEVAVYDLPAIIDRIKNVTKQNRVSYIGNSMGTTESYVLGAEKSEYNNALSIIISLAPVAFMRHTTSPFTLFAARFAWLMNVAATMTKMVELPPANMLDFVRDGAVSLCTNGSTISQSCAALLFIIGGHSSLQLNGEDVTTIIKYVSPVSLRQALHYAQLINSGEFRRYNYGRTLNLKVYGTDIPPRYNLSKVTAPVALFYSKGDWLAQPKDVDLLCSKLPKCVVKQQVKLDTFNHFDFLFSNEVVSLLYEDVIELLNSYSD